MRGRAWLLLMLMVGCQPPAATNDVAEVTRHIDLIRAIQLAGVPERKTIGVEVWELDGDSRAVLFLHSGDSVSLGPFPAAEGCTLSWGMGLRPEVWAKGDGVEFIVSVEREGEVIVLAQEDLSPGELPEPVWVDRQVEVPGSSAGSFSLRLETGEGPRGSAAYDHAGWSHPRLACRSPRPRAPRAISRQRPPVLVISIDTLRQDHLGLYGYDRPTSPTLDRLAREAVVFDNAFAPAPYTLPSHGTLLTGVSPAEHRAGFDFPEAPLSADVRTLAERFRDAGYRTAALTAGGLVSRRFGLARGFDEWRELQRANLASVLPAVFDVLDEESDRPLFFFLHTYDTHGPYQQPEGSRFFSAARQADGDSATWSAVVAASYHGYQELERFEGAEEVVASYDSGIRFVDSQLDRLFAYLGEIGLYDSSVIVVTSDHGESLFEAGRYFGHSHTLEDRELRVPLLIREPGGRGERRGELVTLEDIAPTLLDLASIDGGEDLAGAALLAGDRGRDREYLVGGSSHIGALYVRSREWKLISPPGDHWKRHLSHRFGPLGSGFHLDWQLYDLAADPGERRNLYALGDRPDRIRSLVLAIRAEEMPGRSTGADPGKLDPETEKNLRALGYVQ